MPHHPRLTHKRVGGKEKTVPALKGLGRFLKPDAVFLEIGAGDCSLSFEVARQVKQVYTLEVREVITDGCSVPIPDASVTLAYSNQLREHVHPDDAVEQLGNIYDAIAQGGLYLCITPNRPNGPHNISKYFDRTATGMHLKEHTVRELIRLFTEAGFSRVRPLVVRGDAVFPPAWTVTWTERRLCLLPFGLGRRQARWKPIAVVLGIQLVATK